MAKLINEWFLEMAAAAETASGIALVVVKQPIVGSGSTRARCCCSEPTT
jgi:hypothetical protein